MPPPKDPILLSEYKRKMSEKLMGHPVSDATKLKQSTFAKTQIQTEQKRQKLSKIHAGKTISESHKQRLREYKLGSVVSEETKLKISLSTKGKRKSDKARENIRNGVLRGEAHPLYNKHPSKATLEKQSLSKIGNKSHFWKGGISFDPYCHKFNKAFKNRVREFFSNVCVGCDRTKLENGKDLAVHHVNYDKMACCNNTKPLFVTLCKSCHSKSNGNRSMWNEYYENIINTVYGGRCYNALGSK